MSESKKSTQLKLTDLFNPTASKVSRIDHDEDPTHETSSSPIDSLAHSESLLKQSDPTNSDPYYFSGKSLNDSDRTQLLFDIKMSSSKIVFPATDGRRYSSKWEEKFPWLRYSIQKDAAFCINCLAFCKNILQNLTFINKSKAHMIMVFKKH
ncbi:unnamed protein product [Mytilus edulis]|uniref:Uncharacterized protein n=1 Tax=Mytilus edulis TaxID=6550 RepID=A0A8S3R5I5_MYTED|nr:unnamed protein product [Mytilus edulis]